MSDKDAMLGVNKIGKLIQANRLHPKAHYLITRHDSRLSLCNELRDHLIAECPELTYHTIIRTTEALRQAGCNGQDIFQYAPKCNGAADYRSLAKEIAGKRSSSLKI
jgi:chromosome partitioning protein